MPPDPPSAARTDALAELAAEAARFAAPAPDPAPTPQAERPTPAPAGRTRPRAVASAPAPDDTRAPGGLPGYVPNAVAPERGNTRPAVPVDGRLHLRAAPATLAALDAVVARLRSTDPTGLRDVERATLVRIGVGLVLADVDAHGTRGVVGEAVRAALDPAKRHLDVPMPDPARWLRDAPR